MATGLPHHSQVSVRRNLRVRARASVDVKRTDVHIYVHRCVAAGWRCTEAAYHGALGGEVKLAIDACCAGGERGAIPAYILEEAGSTRTAAAGRAVAQQRLCLKVMRRHARGQRSKVTHHDALVPVTKERTRTMEAVNDRQKMLKPRARVRYVGVCKSLNGECELGACKQR
jgi:hypothetical protein